MSYTWKKLSALLLDSQNNLLTGAGEYMLKAPYTIQLGAILQLVLISNDTLALSWVGKNMLVLFLCVFRSFMLLNQANVYKIYH